MNKFDTQLMNKSLQALCQAEETYSYPVYCGFGKANKWSASSMDNLYGFLAITSKKRIIMTKFNIFGNPVGAAQIPLRYVTSLKISKNIFGQTVLKLEVTYEEKKTKMKINIARKVYAMDLVNQTQNHDMLIEVLGRYE